MDDFKKFDKILHINKLWMTITQKIHGSNAQILIEKNDEWATTSNTEIYLIKAGCRTRWLTLEDDNYGFCKWVMENRQELIGKLGEGRHYGEWAGPGINSGEGLKEKTLVLFNHRRFAGKELPKNVVTVPVLHQGKISLDAINETMERLKTYGSKLVEGFMKPEGIVVDFDGQLYKNVFDEEDVKWKEKTRTIHERIEMLDVSYLFQPLRLEKLLSRDEKYIREYPSSLSQICSDYVKDLEAESQFRGTTEEELKKEKKSLGREIFYFVKSHINKE